MWKKILVFTLITATLLTGCSCSKKTNDEKKDNYTVNEGVLEEKKVGNLEIYDINMKLQGETSTFTIFFKNTSDKSMEIKKINLYFKDKNGKILITKKLDYYSSIEADEVQSIVVLIEKNLSDAVSVDYELAD